MMFLQARLEAFGTHHRFVKVLIRIIFHLQAGILFIREWNV